MMLFMCGISAAEEIMVDNNTIVNTAEFTEVNNDVYFDDDVNSALFEVSQTGESVTVSLEAGAAEAHEQVIGISLDAIPDFSGTLRIDHYTDSGVNDYYNILEPVVVDNIAYMPVEFSTVTITPLYSTIKNWNFETGTVGATPPTNWTGGSRGVIVNNVSYIGTQSYQITGGASVCGQISQTTTITPGYYTIGAWIKSTGTVQGRFNIDIQGGSPSADSLGINYYDNTDWRWVEHREYINSNNPSIRIFVDNSPTANAKWWVDGVLLSKDYSYTADESLTQTHIYQNFTFTPTAVNAYAEMMVDFVNYNISSYNTTAVSVNVDGSGKSASLKGGHVFFDTSGLSAAAHNVVVDVTYTPAIPTVSYTSYRVGNTVQFNDTSSGFPTSWGWDFGDGNYSIEQNASHTYAKSGTYTVTLEATNSAGTGVAYHPYYYTPVAPNNYSHYTDVLFQPNMTGWDLAANMGTFYNDFIPGEIFWIIVLIMPLLTMWNRQNSVILVCIIYLMAGGIMAAKMPVLFGKIGFWMLVLGLSGVMYQMFMRE